jgi:hypothetical protein
MSIAAHRYASTVLDDPATRLSPTARHLLRELADYADAAGTAWPSKVALARRLGVHPSSVWRARRALAAADVIRFTPSSGGRGRTNWYQFPVVELSPTIAPTRPLATAKRSRDATKPSRGRDETVASARPEPLGTVYEPRACDCGAALPDGRWRCQTCQESFAADQLEVMRRFRNRPLV